MPSHHNASATASNQPTIRHTDTRTTPVQKSTDTLTHTNADSHYSKAPVVPVRMQTERTNERLTQPTTRRSGEQAQVRMYNHVGNVAAAIHVAWQPSRGAAAAAAFLFNLFNLRAEVRTREEFVRACTRVVEYVPYSTYSRMMAVRTRRAIREWVFDLNNVLAQIPWQRTTATECVSE